jgi:hypothetical protein
MALELEQTARTQGQARLEAAYEQAEKIKAAGMARGSRFPGETKEERQLGPRFATPAENRTVPRDREVADLRRENFRFTAVRH